MDWFKNHIDTIAVIGSIFSAMIWMNGKFNDVDRRLVKIETILTIKGIMPMEFATAKGDS